MTTSSLPTIRLKPKTQARAIRHGFPWVYDNELVADRRTKAIAPGTIALLELGPRASGDGHRKSQLAYHGARPGP